MSIAIMGLMTLSVIMTLMLIFTGRRSVETFQSNFKEDMFMGLGILTAIEFAIFIVIISLYLLNKK